MRRTILLASGLVILIVAGALVFLKTSAGGFSARADPTFPEIFAAQTARSLAMPSDARARANPVAKTPEALQETMEHWADHCAVCHGNDGAGQVPMGKQMYPHAPDMRKDATQKLTRLSHLEGIRAYKGNGMSKGYAKVFTTKAELINLRSGE